MFRQSAALGGAFVAITVAGVAVAAIPSSDGTIHGCYQKNSGELRVVDAQSSDACRKSESALAWSQQGPAGQQGAQGPKGDTGPHGPGLATWAAYVQPRAADSAIHVGWASSSRAPSSMTYLAPGQYEFKFATSGLDCAVPVATPFSAPGVSLTVPFMTCTGGQDDFQVATSDGADHDFLLQVDFTG